MRAEYNPVFETAKHALCTVGVKSKVGIDSMLGCILALQTRPMPRELLEQIIYTLDDIPVSGVDSLQKMLDVITILEQVRDGTFDLSQITQQEPEETAEE